MDKLVLLEIQSKTSEVADIDDYLNGIPSLRQLRVFVRVPDHLPRKEETEQLVKVALRQCEAKGILSVECHED